MTQVAPAGTTYPGKTLGIVGLVVAIVFNVVGLIISAIALSQSKRAGYKNTPALIGLIIGIILTAASLVVAIIIAVMAFMFVGVGSAS